MRKHLTVCLFLVLFIVTGVSFGGCSSKQDTSPADATSVSKVKNKKAKSAMKEEKQDSNASQPAQPAAGQSLYNSSAMPMNQPLGYYNHGFSDEKLMELSEESFHDAENAPE